MLGKLAMQLAIGLLRLMALLPYGVVARFGDGLGWLLYQVPSRRRRIVHINLKLCFPEWDDAERERVARRHVRHAVRSYVERCFQWFASARRIEKLVVVDSEIDLEDPDLPPTIMLGYHFVAIEAASVALNHALKRRCGSLYQPFSNKELDRVATAARGRFNAEMVSKSDSARAVIRMLRNRQPVMLGADMDYGPRNSAFVPFFGVPACTLTSTARLASTAPAQVCVFVGEVLPGYKGYRLRVFKPWTGYPTGDDVADARHMNAVLEDIVRTMPEQYYWVHKRFKTRPPGEPGFY